VDATSRTVRNASSRSAAPIRDTDRNPVRAARRRSAGEFLVRERGSEVKAHEDETWVEFLLSEPEIVAWLEPDERDDDDGEKATAARRRRR
jgi:hypothetical protein